MGLSVGNDLRSYGLLTYGARCTSRRDSAGGHFPQIGDSMNSNQVKGTAKDVAGKVQQKVGEATGSTSQQVKGVGKQVEGKIQKGVGDVAEAAKDAERKSRP